MRKCKNCGLVKQLRRKQRICDDCKAQRFFRSAHYKWLANAAIKYGVQCLPDTTAELVELLELRVKERSYSGWSRYDGEMTREYDYHLAHRYPASKGGKLIADNLVIMPAMINRTMGNSHGVGLERFCTGIVEKMTRNELRREFMRRYDLRKLERFASKATDNGSDFSTDGMDAMAVINDECRRLCFSIPVKDGVFIGEYEGMIKKYDEICSNERNQFTNSISVKDAMGMLSPVNGSRLMSDVLSIDLEWTGEYVGNEKRGRVSELMVLDEGMIIAMSGGDFRKLLEDAEDLSPIIEKQARVYFWVQEERQRRNEAIKTGSHRWWAS